MFKTTILSSFISCRYYWFTLQQELQNKTTLLSHLLFSIFFLYFDIYKILKYQFYGYMLNTQEIQPILFLYFNILEQWKPVFGIFLSPLFSSYLYIVLSISTVLESETSKFYTTIAFTGHSIH